MLITKANVLEIISKKLNCMYLSDIKTDRYKNSALFMIKGIDADETVKEYAYNYIGKEVTC